MSRLTRKQKNKIDQILNEAQSPSPTAIAEQLNLPSSDVEEYLEYKELAKEKKIGGSPFLRLQFDARLALGRVFLDFLQKNRGKIVLILLAGFFVYSSGLPNTFVSDDLPLLKSPYLIDPLKQMRDEPVSAVLNSITYTLNFLTHGADPLGYHLVNVFLHLAASVLIFFFLSLILEKRIAFLASLIFTIHPLHSEAVFWVSGRHYILYSIFFVLALVFYLFFKVSPKPKIYFYLSLLLFVASVYSFPEQAIVYPFFLLLLDFCLGQFNLKESLRRALPFLILTAIFVFLSYGRVVSRVQNLSNSLQPFQRGEASFLISDVVALATYFKLFLLPLGLTFYHENLSVSIIVLLTMFGFVLSLVFLLPLLTFKKNRFFLLAVGLLILSLLPTLTPLKVSWIVAERYTYLGLIGFSLLLSYLLVFFYNQEKYRKIALLSSLALISFFSITTLLRGPDWKDEDSLWVATAQASPDSSKAWNNMGDYYGRHGDPQKSLEAFQRATQLNPTYSDAWHNLGNVLLQMGRTDEAIPNFEKSLQFNPYLIEAYNNLALAYHRKGDQPKALNYLQKSLSLNNQSPKTYTALGVILYENGDKQKAYEALTTALQLDPGNQSLRQSLLQIQSQLGK